MREWTLYLALGFTAIGFGTGAAIGYVGGRTVRRLSAETCTAPETFPWECECARCRGETAEMARKAADDRSILATQISIAYAEREAAMERGQAFAAALFAADDAMKFCGRNPGGVIYNHAPRGVRWQDNPEYVGRWSRDCARCIVRAALEDSGARPFGDDPTTDDEVADA